MWDFLSHLFDTSGFVPRWHCGDWSAGHGWLHVVSDVAIWGAYTAIPSVLGYFVLRRRDVPYSRLFWLFGAFILACGCGHLIEATLFWHPWYRLSGLVKLVTAIVSWGTVIALVRVTPQALMLPGLARVNAELRAEVAERKRAEALAVQRAEELQARQERTRLFLDGALDAFISIDSAGKIAEWNRQAEEIFGWSRNEVLGRTVAEIIIPPQHRAAQTSGLEHFLATGEGPVLNKRIEITALHRDGHELPVELSVTPVRWQGSFYVDAFLRDLTDRQRAEEKFRLAVESAPNGMVMIGADGRIQLVNAQTEKQFGYARDELVGQPVELLVPDRFRDRHPDYRSNYFATPAARSMGVGRDLFGRRKDGTEFPVEIGLNPIQTEEGPLVLSAIVDITERKRLEQRFRAVVESAPIAMVMIDRDGKIVLVNAQTEILFGHGRNDLLGQPIEVLVPERFRGEHPTMRTGFFTAPAARRMGIGRDLYGLRKDGSEFPVEIGLNPIETEEGIFVLSAIVDITQRKRAEEQFRLVVEAAPSGMIMIAVDGKIVLTNVQTEKLFGYTKDELIGQSVEMLIPVQFRAKHPEYRTKFFTAPQARSMGVGRDLYGLRKDGSEFPVEIGLNPIETEQGRFVLAAIVDITERKHAEQTVRRNEQELSDFFENAVVGLHWLGPDGTVLRANRAELELLGYCSDEYIGHNIREFFVDEHVAADLLHRLAEGDTVNNYPSQLRCQDGASKDVLISANVLRQDGRFIHSRGFTRDITEIKRAQESLARQARELAETNASLIRSNRDLDEFAYVASHDLREPLRGIHNYTTFLIEDYGDKLDADGKAKLQTLQRLSARMDSLIEALLHYSRIGKTELAVQPTNLQEVLLETLDSLRISCEERGVEVRIPRPLPVLVCDKVRVGEIFENLIVNAIKYNDKPEKWVEVGFMPSSQNDASPVFYVRDNGIGIEEKHHVAIFRIFKRLHTRDKFGGGTGAGLTIVQKIVERHGGRIWLQSILGEGTTFYFTIPQET